MPLFDIGLVAVKTLGREAGTYCVVVDVIDKNFVLVDGLQVRRRRVNVKHLIPTKDKVEIKKEASTEEVKKAIDKAKLKDKFASKIKIDV
jgi:large subunit ribosomal protein L14e